MQLRVTDGVNDKLGERFGASLAVLLACDFVWLTFASARLAVYPQEVTEHAAADRRKSALCTLAYACIASGVIATLTANSAENQAAAGALLGFAVFATFNLTTLAIQAHWPYKTAVVDTMYGTAVWALAAYAADAAARA